MERPKAVLFALCFVFLTIILPYSSNADPLDTWYWRNPLPQGNILMRIEYLNGMFVAVGDDGAVVTSSDGESWNWTARHMDWASWNSATGVILRDITYGNGLFVAVGNDRTIITSPDGVNWTIRSRAPGRSNDLNFVSYVKGVFYATSDAEIILASNDGINWVPAEADGQWKVNNKIISGNGVFVTVGYTGSDKYKNMAILYSPDGATWTPVFHLGMHEYAFEWATTIMRANDLFVVWGYASVNGGIVGRVFVSPDGLSWTAHDFEISMPIGSVAYGNGILVAATYGGGLMMSSDGLHWATISLGSEEYLYDVSFGEGTFAAVGETGTIFTSIDGVNWTPKKSSITAHHLNSVAYGNNTFVAVGGYPYGLTTMDNYILTSKDGVNWMLSPSTTGQLFHLAYVDDTFIALGREHIWISPDGINWSERNSGITKQLSGAAYGNGVYVIVGSDGTILTSEDKTFWTLQGNDGLSSNDFHGITFANGIFVAVGNLIGPPPEYCEFDPCAPASYGTIFTSTDGIEWTQRYLGEDHSAIYDVAYGNNIFIAVGWGGTVMTSYDGTNWRENPALGVPVEAVTYASGTFVATGGTDLIMTSTDGVKWTLRDSPGYVNDITYGNNTFLAVGGNGTILQSDFLSGDCTATLSSDLRIHIPIVNFNGRYLWGDADCGVDSSGSIICRVTAYRAANPDAFSDCQPSTLSSDLSLHVPLGIYNNIDYTADFEHVPTGDGQLWFKLSSYHLY